MIIFGTRGVSSRLEEGRFHCPRCAKETPYERKSTRRFVHVFFIPLLPIGATDEFVECAECKSAFDPAVLDHRGAPPAPEFDYAYQRGVLRAMVAVLPPGEARDAERLAKIGELYRAETGVELSLVEVRAVVLQTEGRADAVLEELGELGRNLDAPRKTRLVQATRRAAQTEGAPSDDVTALLRRIELVMS